MIIYKKGKRWFAQTKSHCKINRIYGESRKEVIKKMEENFTSIDSPSKAYEDNQAQMQTTKGENIIKKLSNGKDSTLENWIILSTSAFGENSKQTVFIKEKEKNYSNVIKEEVDDDEGQLLMFLMNMEEDN